MRPNPLSISAALVICTLPCASDASSLFAAPEGGGSETATPSVADSVVTLVASLPYATLAQIADEKLPQSQQIHGDGRIACAGVPFLDPGHLGSHQECVMHVCVSMPDLPKPSVELRNQCANYHWYAETAKVGAAQISRDENSLRLSQGIHVDGKAGVGGDLAGILSLHGKNFPIDATSRIDLTATLDRTWCPLVTAAPVGSWVDSASVEIVVRNCRGFDFGPLGKPQVCAPAVNLGIANVLNGELNKHRDDIQKAAQNPLSCDSVKAKIQKEWRPYAIKIQREKPADAVP